MATRAIVVVLLVASCADAWKWRGLFGDNDGDSVVTVAADGRGIYPVLRAYSGYKTILLRVPAVPDFGSPVVARVRHVYGLPPPPPPPPAPLVPVARYGAPAPQSHGAADTAAAVAAAVARTILEAHGFSRRFDVADSHHVTPDGGRALYGVPRQSAPSYWPRQGVAAWRRRR